MYLNRLLENTLMRLQQNANIKEVCKSVDFNTNLSFSVYTGQHGSPIVLTTYFPSNSFHDFGICYHHTVCYAQRYWSAPVILIWYAIPYDFFLRIRRPLRNPPSLPHSLHSWKNQNKNQPLQQGRKGALLVFSTKSKISCGSQISCYQADHPCTWVLAVQLGGHQCFLFQN